tara:strand:+ start:68 stop:307 length:240 start_codon:yes stop_codon:yes gene_type:complete
MYNNLHSKENKQLVLKIPATILSSNELSFNEKLILGLDYTYQSKKGIPSLPIQKQVSYLIFILTLFRTAERILLKKDTC